MHVRSDNGRLMAEASGRRMRLARDRADGNHAQRNDEKASCRPPENGLAHLPIEPTPRRGVNLAARRELYCYSSLFTLTGDSRLANARRASSSAPSSLGCSGGKA